MLRHDLPLDSLVFRSEDICDVNVGVVCPPQATNAPVDYAAEPVRNRTASPWHKPALLARENIVLYAIDGPSS